MGVQEGVGGSLVRRVAEELVDRFGGFYASKREGMLLLKLNVGGRTVMVWVRDSPITENALRLYDRVVSKHRFDEAWLLKVRNVADYVSFRDLQERFSRILRSINELGQDSD